MYGYNTNYGYNTLYPKGAVAALPFSPDQLAGLTRWYKADSITGLNDGDPITTVWPDDAGNFDATSAGGGNSPTYKTGIVNGHSVVRCMQAGATYFTSMGDLSALTAGEVFVVVQLTSESTGPAQGLFSLGGANQFYPLTASGVIWDDFGTSGQKTTVDPATPLTQWHIYGAHSAANDWSNYIDGAEIYHTNTNTVAFPAAATFLCRDDVYNLEGDMAEFILYSRKLTTDERADVIAYLKSTYGIA